MPSLTNEEKLERIYEIVNYQEKLRKRTLWWGIFKRVIFYGFILFTVTNPTFVMEKVTAVLKPFIVTAVGDVMKDSGADMFEQLKSSIETRQ